MNKIRVGLLGLAVLLCGCDHHQAALQGQANRAPVGDSALTGLPPRTPLNTTTPPRAIPLTLPRSTPAVAAAARAPAPTMPTATTPAPAPISESAAPEPAPSVPVPPPSPENPGSMAAAAAPANSNPDLSSTMASPAASDGAPMTDASPATADSLPGSPGSTADAAADVSQGPVVVVNTAMGQIVIELDDFAAPRTCKNFRELIADGFYNNTVFHRVIPDFIIQGGDPNSKSSAMDRNTYGLGSPGYTLPAEIRLKHDRGAVAMARLPDSVNPNRESNGSQFYICLQACPSLDDQYTVFGHVIRGLDVAEKIAEQPRDPRDNPLKRVEMTVSLEPRDQAMANTANSSGAAGEP